MFYKKNTYNMLSVSKINLVISNKIRIFATNKNQNTTH